MADREKVIAGLEKALAASEAVDSGYIWITVGEGRKALELLKEQKPAEAKTMGESKLYGSWWFACGACGHAIDPEDNYCRECGRRVVWDAKAD